MSAQEATRENIDQVCKLLQVGFGSMCLYIFAVQKLYKYFERGINFLRTSTVQLHWEGGKDSWKGKGFVRIIGFETREASEGLAVVV